MTPIYTRFVKAFTLVLFLFVSKGQAQIITTIAGNGTAGFSGDGGVATSALFNKTYSVALDKSGNVYVVDQVNNRIRKITSSTGFVTTVAGNGIAGFSGDGGLATNANLNQPTDVAVDNSGNLYISDYFNYRIRKVSASTGLITTIAGTGIGIFNGDGIVATSANIGSPTGIALDKLGNVYFSDNYTSRVRKVNTSTGIISTVAGTGTAGFSGDGGAAATANINQPYAVAVDSVGNVYIADYTNQRIRKVDAASGVITTIAGTGTAGFDGDGGIATAAKIYYPAGIKVDSYGNIFIPDASYQRIRKIDKSTGVISTIIGSGTRGYIGDGGNALLASFNYPGRIAFDALGNIYIADSYNNVIRKVTYSVAPTITSFSPTTASTGTTVTIKGKTFTGATAVSFGGTAATSFSVVNDTTITAVVGIGASGSVSVTTSVGTGIFSGFTFNNSPNISYTAGSKVFTVGTAITTFTPTNTGGSTTSPVYASATILAGGGASGAVNGQGSTASFNVPLGIVPDALGNLYVADYGNNIIRKITSSGLVSTFAGSGTIGSTDGAGTAASFYAPSSIVIDSAGNLIVADYSNNKLRKITPSGIVSTFVGNGTAADVDGTGIAASLNRPYSLAIDAIGNIYVGEIGGYRIRKVTPSGVVTTYAGTGVQGSNNGATNVATFQYISALTFDATGNLFIADNNSYLIRKITPAGIVSTFAGNGTAGYIDGKDTSASFSGLKGIAADGAGNLYVCDGNGTTVGNKLIRKITPTGLVSTLPNISINGINRIALDGFGNLLVSAGNVNTLTGTIYKVGQSYSINPPLPKGLNLDLTTGSIFGTPTTISSATTYSVTATNYSGSSTATVSITTTALVTAPTITSFTPTSASTGTTVTIKGTYLTGATAVSFGGTAATSYSVVNDTTITAVVGAGTTGSLSITTSGGTATKTGFTYTIPPIITSFTPTTAPKSATITIKGTKFTGATAVSFGGTAATSFVVVNDTIITAVVGAGTSGSVSISTASGTGTLSGFTYLAAPTIAYTGGTKTFTVGTAITALSPTNTGGTVSGNGQVVVSTFAGSGSIGSADGVGTAASFNYPLSNAFDASGNMYVADAENNRIRKISSTGAVTTFAGSGVRSFSDGSSNSASFSAPTGVVTDVLGNVYVADLYNNRIRKISQTGIVSTFAGSGNAGNADGIGTAASFNNPTGLAIDANSNVYVTDKINHSIRKISPAGVVTTLAGNGNSGNTNGVGTAASFYYPTGVTLDNNGNIYVADYFNNSIRKITTAGVVTTFAGSGTAGYADGTGASAKFNLPFCVTVDGSGNLIVGDQSNNYIRKINSLGVVTTLAGNGTPSYADGIGTAASFNTISGVAKDANGNIYIADESNQRIRKITPGFGYTISPSLPTGLSFDGSTGTISGTATVTSAATTYTITATNMAGSSSTTISISTVAPPTVTTFTPTTALTGTIVTIKGTKFTGATAISFGGTAATNYTVVNDSTISAVVGSGSSGSVAVTTSGGTATKTGFSFCTAPVTKPVTYSSCSSVAYKTKTYTTSTIVRDTLKSVGGCDSIYNVATITITPITPTTISYSYSNCKSVIYNGVTYTSSTIKRDTTKSVGGCDSIYKVATITITPITPTTISYSYSNCKSVVYNGITYTSSTVKRDTTKSVGGCDSLYKVATITITPITPTTLSYSYSNCKSVLYNGITYTSSTIKRDTTKSVGGCDSIYNVASITITPITPTMISYSYSNCKSVLYNGVTYTSSTVKRDTTKSVGGCDSIYKVASITITPITPTTINYSYSNCKSVLYNGINYTSSTIKRDTTKSVGGCDSVYKVVTITIAPISPTTMSYSYSNCKSLIYNGVTYTSSTIKRDTTKSVGGCDSIYKVATITITPITPTTITSTVTGCSSVTYNGITYTISTVKRDTTKSVGGCDSVYKVATITVNIPLAPMISVGTGKNPLCAGAGDSLVLTTTYNTAVWIRNNSVIPNATGSKYVAQLYGSYSVYTTDANGCSSKSAPVVLNEQFVPAPTVTTIGNVLTSSYSSGNQWYRNFTIPIANTASYTMDTTLLAQYSVQTTVNGCKSPMSNYVINTRDSLKSVNVNCPTVTTPTLFSSNPQKVDPNVVTLTYEGANLSVKLFPNPSGSNAFVQITGVTTNSDINVTDMLGRVVWRSAVGSNRTISLPAGTLAKGVYLVSVTNEGQHQEIKWVINR